MRAALLVMLAVASEACGVAREEPVKPRFARLGVSSREGRPELADVSITLGRTSCMGACPVYEVTLHGTGVLVYEGRAHVTTQGRWEENVSPGALLPILDAFEAIDFMSTEHRCSWLGTDAPMIDLRLRIGTRQRRFFAQELPDLEGVEASEIALHSSIEAIARQIEAAADIAAWIGTEPERKKLYEKEQEARRVQQRR